MIELRFTLIELWLTLIKLRLTLIKLRLTLINLDAGICLPHMSRSIKRDVEEGLSGWQDSQHWVKTAKEIFFVCRLYRVVDESYSFCNILFYHKNMLFVINREDRYYG